MVHENLVGCHRSGVTISSSRLTWEPLDGPRRTPATAALVDQLQAEGVGRALVFFNASDLDHGLLGAWRVTLEPLVCMPQGLDSLAFNVLTATSIYLEFLDRIGWRYVNYL